jgi:beta-glucanase (GH16 family)
MTRSILLLTIIAILSSCNSESKWELTFSDEFKSNTLDRSIWDPKWSWGQHQSGKESVLMVDNAFEIVDGILRIKCEKKDTIGRVYLPDWSMTDKKFSYTSGHLYTRNSFTQLYGKFEMRAKAAFGKGFNSAFWMMTRSGWPPEIDIFEILGKDPNILRTTNHYLDKNGKRMQNSKRTITPDLSADFHLYAIEWEPTEIRWYFDDQLVFTSRNGVPNEPMFILISHALGGDFADYPDESTPLPAFFEIDYVRVYKLND